MDGLPIGAHERIEVGQSELFITYDTSDGVIDCLLIG